MDILKILVVDDESRMRKLVKDFLTKKNFKIFKIKIRKREKVLIIQGFSAFERF